MNLMRVIFAWNAVRRDNYLNISTIVSIASRIVNTRDTASFECSRRGAVHVYLVENAGWEYQQSVPKHST